MHEALPTLLSCPFCGADAEAGWIVPEGKGKSFRVGCSRNGECPSPTWVEAADEHEDDAACIVSVATFWNTRAADWDRSEVMELRLRVAFFSQELRIAKIERDRAMKACEQVAAIAPAPTTGEG